MRLLMALAVVLLAAPPAKPPVKAPSVKTPSAKTPSAKKSAVKQIVAVVTPAVSVLETVEKPTVDYQAEVYSGVPLDDPYAKERGVDKGLVRMVFEKQRKLAFRIAHERIRKRVRFTGESARDHVDVIETEDGFVVVETTTSNAGIFTSSDVYVFGKNTTIEQRLALVTRERVRQAMQAYR